MFYFQFIFPDVLPSTLRFLVPGDCDFLVYCALLHNNIYRNIRTSMAYAR